MYMMGPRGTPKVLPGRRHLPVTDEDPEAERGVKCLVSDACPGTVVAVVGTQVSLAAEIPQPTEEPDSLPWTGLLQTCSVLQDGF